MISNYHLPNSNISERKQHSPKCKNIFRFDNLREFAAGFSGGKKSEMMRSMHRTATPKIKSFPDPDVHGVTTEKLWSRRIR